MRARCRQAERVAVELVGPRLSGPDEAVAALRVSAEQPEKEGVVVLVCDEHQRIVLAVDFPGAGVDRVAEAVGYVVEAAHGLGSMSLVAGLFRAGTSTNLDDEEVAAVADLLQSCRSSRLHLLDVIVVAGHRWRSLAETPGWCG